jgi:hypothetical protein
MSPRKTAHGLERATHRVRNAWGNARAAVGRLDVEVDPRWRRGYAEGLRRALDILIEEPEKMPPDRSADSLERAIRRVRDDWDEARRDAGDLDMLTDARWRDAYATGLGRALDILIEEQQRQAPDDTRNGPTHAEQSLPPG